MSEESINCQCADDDTENNPPQQQQQQRQIQAPSHGPLVNIRQIPGTSRIGSGFPTTKIRLKGIPTVGNSDANMQQTTRITIFGAGRRPTPASSYAGSARNYGVSRQNVEHEDRQNNLAAIEPPRTQQSPKYRVYFGETSSQPSSPSSCHGSHHANTYNNPDDAHTQRVFAADGPADGAVAYAQTLETQQQQLQMSPAQRQHVMELQQQSSCQRLGNAGVRAQASESRLQAPQSRLQAPQSRLQAPQSRLQAPQSRLQAPQSRLQAPQSRLQVSQSRSQTSQSRLQAPQSRLQEPQSRLQAPQSRLQAPQSRLQTSQSRLQAPQSRLQTSQSQLQAPQSRLQAPQSRLQAPQSRLQAPQSKLQASQSRLQALSSRLDDLKSRLQSPQLRVQASSPRARSPCGSSPTSRTRLQAPSPRLQAPSPRLQSPCGSSPTSRTRLQAPSPRLQALSPRLQSPCGSPPTSQMRFEEPQPRLQATSPRLQSPCGSSPTSRMRFEEAQLRLQATSPRLHPTSPRLQATSPRLQSPCGSSPTSGMRFEEPQPRLQAPSPRLQSPCGSSPTSRMRFEEPQQRFQAPSPRLQSPCGSSPTSRMVLEEPQPRLQATSPRLQSPCGSSPTSRTRLQEPSPRLYAPSPRLQAPSPRLQVPSPTLQAPCSSSPASRSRLGEPQPIFQAPQVPCSSLPTSRSRLQAPSSRLQAPASRLQTPSSRLQAPGSRLKTPSSRLQTPSSRLQTPSSRLQAPRSKLQASQSRSQEGLRLQTPRSRLQAPQSRMQAPGSRLQAPTASTSRLQKSPHTVKTKSSPEIPQERSIKVPTPAAQAAVAPPSDADFLNKSFIPSSAEEATIDEIKNLVEEENRDVAQSQSLSPELATKLKQLKKKTLLEETLQESMPTLNVDVIEGEDSSSSPQSGGSDVVASLMHSEERGVINTVSSPKRMYDALFGASGALEVALEDERSVAVSPAAPSPLNDIVVPVGEASQHEMAVLMPEIEYQVAQTDQEIPKADAYSESVQQGQTPQVCPTRRECSKRNASPPGVPVSYIPRGELEEEKAPWDIDLGSLEDLVGGQISILSTGEHLPSDESIRATLQRFEYILDVEKPKHYSCVQLRGTQRPSWFPGYFFVHPENGSTSLIPSHLSTDNYVKVEHDPSKVFAQAWNIFKPNNLRGNSEVVML